MLRTHAAGLVWAAPSSGVLLCRDTAVCPAGCSLRRSQSTKPHGESCPRLLSVPLSLWVVREEKSFTSGTTQRTTQAPRGAARCAHNQRFALFSAPAASRAQRRAPLSWRSRVRSRAATYRFPLALLDVLLLQGLEAAGRARRGSARGRLAATGQDGPGWDGPGRAKAAGTHLPSGASALRSLGAACSLSRPGMGWGLLGGAARSCIGAALRGQPVSPGPRPRAARRSAARGQRWADRKGPRSAGAPARRLEDAGISSGPHGAQP